jgi:hypothetical protein
MQPEKKKTQEGITAADDNVDHSARYSGSGEITRDDERDQKDAKDDWNAEDSRTGRHK